MFWSVWKVTNLILIEYRINRQKYHLNNWRKEPIMIFSNHIFLKIREKQDFFKVRNILSLHKEYLNNCHVLHP